MDIYPNDIKILCQFCIHQTNDHQILVILVAKAVQFGVVPATLVAFHEGEKGYFPGSRMYLDGP